MSDGAQHPWQHPVPDRIPSCPAWTFPPRVDGLEQLWTCMEVTFSF